MPHQHESIPGSLEGNFAESQTAGREYSRLLADLQSMLREDVGAIVRTQLKETIRELVRAELAEQRPVGAASPTLDALTKEDRSNLTAGATRTDASPSAITPRGNPQKTGSIVGAAGEPPPWFTRFIEWLNAFENRVWWSAIAIGIAAASIWFVTSLNQWPTPDGVLSSSSPPTSDDQLSNANSSGVPARQVVRSDAGPVDSDARQQYERSVSDFDIMWKRRSGTPIDALNDRTGDLSPPTRDAFQRWQDNGKNASDSSRVHDALLQLALNQTMSQQLVLDGVIRRNPCTGISCIELRRQWQDLASREKLGIKKPPAVGPLVGKEVARIEKVLVMTLLGSAK